MRLGRRTCIAAAPGELTQGLFGGVFLLIFEILPHLEHHRVYPAWSVASNLYGSQPDFVVVPGLLDLAYEAPTDIDTVVRLKALREDACYALGNDWPELHRLWSSYFRAPERVQHKVAELGDLTRVLGVHFRGTDKTRVSWDSNPISFDDFTLIILDFLKSRPELERVLVATDEPDFIDHLTAAVHVPVVSMGAGRHHMEAKTDAERSAEADRPLTDCVALSRCAAVLNTSSALSAFAKVLNPTLEIYRCAASKLFTDIPYFPIAFIPAYESSDPRVQQVLARTMADDWKGSRAARRFDGRFAYRRRTPIRTHLRKLLRQGRRLRSALRRVGA